FVVKRIGLTHTRRLALTAARFDGVEAGRLGVVHFVEHDSQALAQRVDEVLGQVLQCAPGANARTKALLLASVDEPLETVLDRGAQWFAEAVRSEEGVEGTQAFVQKRKPSWSR
ncbi:enoyl-CoA hydratase, partial [Pseudomonas aeruginosa]